MIKWLCVFFALFTTNAFAEETLDEADRSTATEALDEAISAQKRADMAIAMAAKFQREGTATKDQLDSLEREFGVLKYALDCDGGGGNHEICAQLADHETRIANLEGLIVSTRIDVKTNADNIDVLEVATSALSTKVNGVADDVKDLEEGATRPMLMLDTGLLILPPSQDGIAKEGYFSPFVSIGGGLRGSHGRYDWKLGGYGGIIPTGCTAGLAMYVDWGSLGILTGVRYAGGGFNDNLDETKSLRDWDAAMSIFAVTFGPSTVENIRLNVGWTPGFFWSTADEGELYLMPGAAQVGITFSPDVFGSGG